MKPLEFEDLGEKNNSITVTTSIDLWAHIDDLRGEIESNLECAGWSDAVVEAIAGSFTEDEFGRYIDARFVVEFNKNGVQCITLEGEE